jgi:hypothetical protein
VGRGLPPHRYVTTIRGKPGVAHDGAHGFDVRRRFVCASPRPVAEIFSAGWLSLISRPL